jgi:hypothetical protein
MAEHPLALWVEVRLEPDAEAAELEDAASQLQQELLGLDVDAVERPPGEPPPPGTRAAEAALLGTVVVAAGRTAMAAVLHTIRSWVARTASRTVRITLDGDTIEVANASDEDQRRLIEAFLARHESAPP